MLRLPVSPSVDDMPFGVNIKTNLPEAPGKTFMGYKNPDAKFPIRALQNIAKHPNFGGHLMIVSPDCEKLTVERLEAKRITSPIM